MRNKWDFLSSSVLGLTAFEHTSRSIEENEFDPDEGNERRCDACSFPIFSTPYKIHKDESGHHLFLHKCCAELPEVLMNHPLHPREPLHLHNKLLDDNDVYFTGMCCVLCLMEDRGSDIRRGFFYVCPDLECRFALHIECATQVKIVHRSHRHELTLVTVEKDQICNACGLTHPHAAQFYWWCYLCKFYLHQDCALLPNMIRNKNHVVDGQQHPLALAYTLPRNSFRFRKSQKCSICSNGVSLIEFGIYFCTVCEYSAHIKCATSDASHYDPVPVRDIATGLPHFPMKDEHTSLIPYSQKKGCIYGHGSSSIEEEKKLLKEKIHDHDLILYEKYSDDESGASQLSYLCNACIDPILPPFYSCPQCNDFYLHKCCANLPLQFQHLAHETKHDQPLELLPQLPSFSNFRLRCETGCGRYNNAYQYGCDTCHFFMDVKCALLPEAVTFEFHGKSHILILSHEKEGTSICDCCKLDMVRFYYECASCPNFKIHARCILLPSTVSHKYDRHPLKLTPSQGSTSKDSKEDFCEICEEDIDTIRYNIDTGDYDIDTGYKEWFYHCKECVTSFHIDCIPCAGQCAKIKFGKSIRVQCHECPLTCIRLLNSYSYTCGLCKEPIEGRLWEGTNQDYEPGMAFECIKCGFWLHYRCARNDRVDDD